VPGGMRPRERLHRTCTPNSFAPPAFSEAARDMSQPACTPCRHQLGASNHIIYIYIYIYIYMELTSPMEASLSQAWRRWAGEKERRAGASTHHPEPSPLRPASCTLNLKGCGRGGKDCEGSLASHVHPKLLCPTFILGGLGLVFFASAFIWIYLGLGLGVWGLGFGTFGLGFGVWSLGCGVWGVGSSGLGCGVWGLGFGARGLGFGGLWLGFGCRGQLLFEYRESGTLGLGLRA